MQTALMLDSLGERYGMLPSQVLQLGNTLDLWVFDVAITYRNYKADENNKKTGVDNKNVDKKALEEHFKKVKGSGRRNKNKQT